MPDDTPAPACCWCRPGCPAFGLARWQAGIFLITLPLEFIMPDNHSPDHTNTPAMFAVSMVHGLHPGQHIRATSEDEARAEYRRLFQLADDVELWVVAVPR
jgi:hypothetical protein